MTFGQWHFWASGYDEGSKVSRLDNLLQVEKSLGRKPAELEQAPTLADNLQYIWQIFVSIRNQSEGAIRYSDLFAYQQFYGALKAFEVDAIIALDVAWQKERHK